MGADGGGIGLPQMSEREMFDRLLSEDSERGDSEPAIAAGIGEQMLHMDLRPLPRSMRARIRDIAARVPARNALLIGGGIGHLAAWLLDLWCGDPANPPEQPPPRPDSFRIVEPGGKFGVIIDRLVRRHGAESWTQIIAKPWQEVSAEAASWSAATTALPRARYLLSAFPISGSGDYRRTGVRAIFHCLGSIRHAVSWRCAAGAGARGPHW